MMLSRDGNRNFAKTRIGNIIDIRNKTRTSDANFRNHKQYIYCIRKISLLIQS